MEVILENNFVTLLPTYRVSTPHFEFSVTSLLWAIFDLKFYVRLIYLLLLVVSLLQVYIYSLDLVTPYLKYVSLGDLYRLGYFDESTSSRSYVLQSELVVYILYMGMKSGD